MLRRLLRNILVFGLLGFAANLVVAWLLTVLVDVQTGQVSSAQIFQNEWSWEVTRYQRTGAIQLRSIRRSGLNWSPQQATGAPDTPTAGDQVTAWASASSDGMPVEWLLLEYGKAVIPREVHVYETYCPGALFKVTVFDEQDREIAAWAGQDPTPVGSGIGVSKIPVSLNVKTRRVKIYLASQKVAGWNEIDAVALVSDSGELQWARRASASTTYASGVGSATATGVNPVGLLPMWSSLHQPTKEWVEESSRREDLIEDARGWPMLALKSRRDLMAGIRVPKPVAPTTAPATLPVSIDVMGFELETIPASGGTGKMSRFIPAGTPPPGPLPTATPQPGQTPLPIRPIWSGLLGNTIFYGVIFYVTWTVMVIPRRFFREVSRFRSGCCIHCGYNLGYDFIKGCPECGWRRAGGDTPP